MGEVPGAARSTHCTISSTKFKVELRSFRFFASDKIVMGYRHVRRPRKRGPKAVMEVAGEGVAVAATRRYEVVDRASSMVGPLNMYAHLGRFWRAGTSMSVGRE